MGNECQGKAEMFICCVGGGDPVCQCPIMLN